jgi:hypothetical protein
MEDQSDDRVGVPGTVEKVLCEPSCTPLSAFVVRPNSLNHKGSRSKSQSNAKGRSKKNPLFIQLRSQLLYHMFKSIIPLILITLLLANCQNDTSPTVRTIEINPTDSTGTEFSDYFEMEQYIVLETSDSSLMQNIRKIYIANNKIFILTWGDAQILIFDINGKFIGKINKNGRGPEEYSYAVDFSISSNGDTLCLFDKELAKLIYYSPNGKFFFSKSLNADLETYLALPDGNIVGYSHLNYVEPLNDTIYQLWYFDKNGKILDGCLPVSKNALGNSIGLASSFNTTSSGHFFIPYTQSIIYKIYENPFSITPVFKIDFKDRSMPDNLLDLPRKEMNDAFKKAYVLCGEFIGTKVLLLNIYSADQRKFLVAIYNIATGTHDLFDSNTLYDNINELPVNVNLQNTYLGKDRLIAVTDPVKLLNHQYKNMQSTGYLLKQKVKETDNPIVVIYKEK